MPVTVSDTEKREHDGEAYRALRHGHARHQNERRSLAVQIHPTTDPQESTALATVEAVDSVSSARSYSGMRRYQAGPNPFLPLGVHT